MDEGSADKEVTKDQLLTTVHDSAEEMEENQIFLTDKDSADKNKEVPLNQVFSFDKDSTDKNEEVPVNHVFSIDKDSADKDEEVPVNQVFLMDKDFADKNEEVPVNQLQDEGPVDVDEGRLANVCANYEQLINLENSNSVGDMNGEDLTDDAYWNSYTDALFAVVDHDLFADGTIVPYAGSSPLLPPKADQVTLSNFKCYPSATEIRCCEFSADGKSLACGGMDNKAVLFSTDKLEPANSMERHMNVITDIRFSPMAPYIATASYDKTVRIWSLENLRDPIRTLHIHEYVTSVDFHPKDDDTICSSDAKATIVFWSIKTATRGKTVNGGSLKVRFQPSIGKYIAAIIGCKVSIFDANTLHHYFDREGHACVITSICWDTSGEYLASLSSDSVRLWNFQDGGMGDCVSIFPRNEKVLKCCVFHPVYSSLVIIGYDETLVIWDRQGDTQMELNFPGEDIYALAASKESQLIASVDCFGRRIRLLKIGSAT